ncbi:MAG TPA: hypothetical protein VGE97_02265 [Nitrososphaera sp.]
MAVNWGKFTLKQILSQNYPPVFWTWAGWNDRGRIPPAPLPVLNWIKKHGAIPRIWYLRYYVHKGLKPPVFIPKPGPVPIPQHPLSEIFQWAMLCADDPASAINVKSHYRFFLTADPAYDPGAYTVDRIRERHALGAWCNPLQVSRERMSEFIHKYRIDPDAVLGQGENHLEFEQSRKDGYTAMVGVLSSLYSTQKDFIRDHRILWLEEDYWNVQPWLQLNFENLPVVATVKGTYNGKEDSPTYGSYKGPQDYIAAHRWNPGDGAYHAAGPADFNRNQDYALFP